MDATYINPLLKAVVSVMHTMAKQDVERGEILVKRNRLAFGEVSSVIDMVGTNVTGSISVSFPITVILDIAKVMLPPGTKCDNAIIKDLTGEMANMFAGGAKSALENQGHKFQMSLPRILTGKPHYIKHKVKAPTVFIPFTSESGAFFVELCFFDLNVQGLKKMAG